MQSARAKRGKFWTIDGLEAMKSSVREDLEARSKASPATERLELILDEMDLLGDASDSDTLLRRYVLSMAALAQHLRTGGLGRREIKRLCESIHNILRLQRIHPGSSRLAYLHGEFRTVLSQLQWLQGELWSAAWSQQLATMWAKDTQTASEFVVMRAMGRRYLRLGYGSASLVYFQKALENAGNDAHMRAAYLSYANAARLCGQLAVAQDLLSKLQEKFADAADDIDVQWQWMCLKFAESQDCREMIRATKTGKPHHQSDYIAEARLYTYACQSQSKIDDLMKMSTLTRNGTLSNSNTGPVFAGLTALETCYNFDIPTDVRLQALEDALASAHEILNLEKEMLLLAAAARWLSRAHLLDLGNLVIQRYRALAVTLTGSANTDPLGVIDDLLQRPWTQLRPA